MKKRIIAVLLTFAMCILPMPLDVQAGGAGTIDVNYEDTEEEDFGGEDPTDIPDDEDEDDACSIGPEDLCVKPAKKIMAKGSTFKITVAMREGSIFEELSDEEWDALYEHDVASVEFKSNKPSVAKVNAKGKVTAKKNGNCRITTTIYLIDGTSWSFRTRVYVSR